MQSHCHVQLFLLAVPVLGISAGEANDKIKRRKVNWVQRCDVPVDYLKRCQFRSTTTPSPSEFLKNPVKEGRMS